MSNLRPRNLALRLAHSAQRSLYPGTFLLDKWLNVAQGKTARDDDLDTVRIDQDPRI